MLRVSVLPAITIGRRRLVRRSSLEQWKRTTTFCNEDRIKNHLYPAFEAQKMRSFGREELQAFLDTKAAERLSFSVVDHLRWDLRQIFRMALAEEILSRNPAERLFTPRRVPAA